MSINSKKENKTRTWGTIIPYLLVGLLILDLSTAAVTTYVNTALGVYESPLTQSRLGPMDLEQGEQYLLFFEGPFHNSLDGGGFSKSPNNKHPELPQVVTMYDSNGSVVPLVSQEYVYKYFGFGKMGISTAAFQARESGVQFYEVTVDSFAWEEFAAEFDWVSNVGEANKLVIRKVPPLFWVNLWIVFAINVGVIACVLGLIWLDRAKKETTR
jgi:hypothetical protein